MNHFYVTFVLYLVLNSISIVWKYKLGHSAENFLLRKDKIIGDWDLRFSKSMMFFFFFFSFWVNYTPLIIIQYAQMVRDSSSKKWKLSFHVISNPFRRLAESCGFILQSLHELFEAWISCLHGLSMDKNVERI